MRIAIVGAFDRMNYGDLLFPIVLNEFFRERFGSSTEITFYGHRSSDLTAFGGFRTKPMRNLFRPKELPRGSVVVIAGGEVLGANWKSTLYNLLGKKTWWQRLANKVSGPHAELWLIRRFLGCRNKFPYLFHKSDFSKAVTVIYNAVGGANLESKDKLIHESIASVLTGADYLTVRDQTTIKILKDTGISLPGLALAPDSATVISDLFPPDTLNSRISNETSEIKKRLLNKSFLTFQIGINFVKNNTDIEIIANQLNMLSEATSYSIVLLPIGRASGHDDQVALTKIMSLLKQPVIFPENNTVFDTMWLIANSKLFIGTSLHGAITAISFCIPHLALTKKDKKIPAYLDTWDLIEQRNCEEFSDICEAALSRLEIPKDKLEILSNELIKKTRLALNQLCNTIETRQT